jgi:hypothetical protein
MTANDIQAVMKRIPQLTAFGIGTFKEGDTAEFHRGQEELLASVEQCTKVCEWLSRLDKQKTINTRRSSYGLKHLAERAVGYVANGVFIAAAVHCGFPYRLSPGSPNVCFGISERSVKRAETAL